MQDRRTMIQVALRTVLGTVVGLIVAFILILGVEAFGGVVHPIPEGFDGSTEAMCRHVERFPGWVLAAVVPMWGLTALVGTWLARRVGTLYAAGIVGLLLTAAVVLNISMLPYPIWFKISVVIAVPAAGFVGGRLARRRSTA